MKAQIAKVESSLDQMKRQESVLARFAVDVALANDAVTAVALDARLWEIVSAPKLPLRKLQTLVEEVIPGVVTFPALNGEFVRRILVETRRFTAFRASLSEDDRASLLHRPKFKNVPLDCLGMHAFQDFLLQKVVSPFADLLFSDFDGATGLDFRHAYVIGYGTAEAVAKAQASGAAETDASGHVARAGLELHTGLSRDFPFSSEDLGALL